MSHTERIIVLVDMDCFYCQVEENLNPSLKGKPVAVVQYNAWKGGGIIAVNYTAREHGVTRHMRGKEATIKCPEIRLVSVPTVREKADLTKYREAGKSVAKVLQTFTPLLERASVDEAYLDITEAVNKRHNSMTSDVTLSQLKNTHVVGCDTIEFIYDLYQGGIINESNIRLAVGAVITEEIRAAILDETGYTSSAGIAHNKILAKLACGLHKPNKQTILPQDAVEELYKSLPVRKIRSLGGKFGNALSEDLGIQNMSELVNFNTRELTKRYDEKTALWLYNIARGIDYEPVTTRLVSKSIGCCKKFPGKTALTETDSILHWLNALSLEIIERLEKDLEENNRKAKQVIVSFSQRKDSAASSRTINLSAYDAKKIAQDAFEALKKNCSKTSAGGLCLTFLGISAGKFEDLKNVNEITDFFKVRKNDVSETPRNLLEQTTETQSILNDDLSDGAETFKESFKTTELYDDIRPHSRVFLNKTQNLDENSADFIFLNETHFNNENNSDDSISNELIEHTPKESFFARYFENLKNQKPPSPAVRDFNTSRNLDEQNSEEEIFTDDDCVSDIANPLPSTSDEALLIEGLETCKECGENVVNSSMVSHMDYHFALRLVNEEKEMYKKPNIPVIPLPKKDTSKKSGKRKMKERGKTNSTLRKFLVSGSNALYEGDVEVCPECGKNIQTDEFSSHLDYHVAKKLHLEINQVKNFLPDSTKTKKGKDGNVSSVSAFFKPVA